MDLSTILQVLHTKTIYDIKLRVTYYARVSSDSDAQLNSLLNQESHYIELIKNNPNWTLVPGYFDEGISGATVDNRKGFLRMIEDASCGLFDLIITKEISRFARDTLSSIEYTRLLLSYGIGVLFENDGINTLDKDSELRLAIMSSIAQDELRKLSSRVKFGHKQAIEAGKVLGNSRIYGYRKAHGRLVIDEDEAKMVRELFDLCASSEYSLRRLADILYEKGYHNHNGGKISYMTVESIIANPKYKGHYVGNKYRTTDIASRKQILLPQEDWITYKDSTGNTVPAIVDENLWEKANTALAARKEYMKNRRGSYSANNLFTKKLFCTYCGVPYYLHPYLSKDGKKHKRWICSNMIEHGTSVCPSFALYEQELCSAIISAFSSKKIAIGKDKDPKAELNVIEKNIKAIEEMKQSILTDNALGRLNDSEYCEKNTQLKGELEKLISTRNSLLQQESSVKKRSHILKKMSSVINQMTNNVEDISTLTRLVDEFIDRILVTANDDGESITLDIRIITGDSYSHIMKIPKNRKLKRKN